MAVIRIIFGCFLGAVAGLVHLVFLGASVWQAFLTYAAVSLILSVVIICAALIVARLNGTDDDETARTCTDLEAWQDWQTQEEMDAHRPRAPALTEVESTEALTKTRRTA